MAIMESPDGRTPLRGRAVALEALASHTAEEVEHAIAEAFAPRLYDLLSGEQDQ